MVRNVGRSRACAICKQRKVRCGEQVPECEQCLKTGRACPGPLQGTLFLDVSSNRARSPAVRDNRPANTYNSRPSHQVNYQQPLRTEKAADIDRNDRDTSADENVSKAFRLPTSYQPDRRDPFQSLFLDSFICAFFKARRRAPVWADALPSLLQQHSSAAIVYAIRAATMASYGKKTGDLAIQSASRRNYIQAMSSQRLQTQLAQTKLAQGVRAREVFGVEMMCVPMLLALFETSMATSKSAWAQHCLAAGYMLEAIGPEQCQAGIWHLFFKFHRVCAVYIGITWEEEDVFASERWCEVPFKGHVKSCSDKLIDIMLRYPRCFCLRKQMRQAYSDGHHEEAEADRTELHDTASTAITQLSALWPHYQKELDTTIDQSLFYEDSNFAAPVEDWILHSPANLTHNNLITATLVADYDAAVILGHDFLEAADPPHLTPYHRTFVAKHTQSILEVVRFHISQGPNSGGDASLLFPLKSAWFCVNARVQKREVGRILVNWGKDRGVDGMLEEETTAVMEGRGLRYEHLPRIRVGGSPEA